MRNITRCDICLKEKNTETPRVPEGFVLMDGLDLCKECNLEYNKRRKKLIRDLCKEKEPKKNKRGGKRE